MPADGQKPDQDVKQKEVLAAAARVGSSAYRLAIFSQVVLFPFFVYWYYFRTLDVFITWKTLESFLSASIVPAGSAVIRNMNYEFIKIKGDVPWKWYSPILSLVMLPPCMKLYETIQHFNIPPSESWAVIGHIAYWDRALMCDLYWCLLVSPLWLIYWYGKRTARQVYLGTVTTENKAALDAIVAKNV